MPNVTVHSEPGAEARADALARRLELPRGAGGDIELVATPDRLELRVVRSEEADLVGGSPVIADWLKVDTTSPAGRSRKGPLPKAAWPRRWPDPPHVLDATAGLGEDAWLLARLGCTVTAVERSPIVFALLEDAHARAADAEDADAREAAARIRLVHADALDVLRDPEEQTLWDVVAIDPMFPAGRKTTERKAMRVLRRLTDPPDVGEEARLLEAARRAAARRVIVKRPRLGPTLTEESPSQRVPGKAIRFDIYEQRPGQDKQDILTG
jgi:16S rRNA (guanine1516-N2)-methyltransferase